MEEGRAGGDAAIAPARPLPAAKVRILPNRKSRSCDLMSGVTLDLTAGYDLTEEVRLTGRVMNVGNKEYSDVWGYATRDRTAYLSVQARW